jgi:uncharacterized protein YdhG (YjbR/CyaY superfamily)
MRKEYTSFDAYFADQPAEVRPLLESMRQTIAKSAPAATEHFRYAMPTFRFRNKNLVHFAAFSGHIGFYPGPEAIVYFQDKLTKYETSKGAIRFPLDQPLPLKLVSEITKHRLKEVEATAKSPKKS